ncbi:hypothetical protein [Bosea lathyri]|uniref:hypothetical protein n=1 Tax=Bosea lathyri TaxID=1036778 RepID=UPI0011B0245F|nr:hypothetical protein [Bosea lathyri]
MTVWKRIKPSLQSAKFYALWLPVMIAFKLRERRAYNEISPKLWLSSGELIYRDLEMYDEVDGHKLDKSFLDELVKTRTDLHDKIAKRLILTLCVFSFLFANFLSLKIDFKVGGFDLKYSPAIAQGLLLVTNMIAVHTLMMQNSLHILDSTIKFIVIKSIPPELHQIYFAKIFNREHYPSYTPYNLPHITFNPLNTFMGKYTAVAFLTLLCGSGLIYVACNIWMIYDMIFNPKFGWISISIGAYIVITGIFAFLYMIITRFKLPYTDYTHNQELELLGQIDPDRRALRSSEIYDKLISLRREMVERGYLKKV